MHDSDRRRARAARPGPRRAKVMNVVRVSSGNFLEMFRFHGLRLLCLLDRTHVFSERECFRIADAGRALALIYLWQLQWGNGGDAHRDYANRGPNDRVFAGLQSGDRLVRRQYAGHLYLFDSYHQQQSHAGSLDVCSRFGGIGRCLVGRWKAGCAEFDSGRSVDLGADRLVYWSSWCYGEAAPKGQGSIAQALAWVTFPKADSPVRAEDIAIRDQSHT